MVPLEPREVDLEVQTLFRLDLMRQAHRGEALREAIQSLLSRRIGPDAFQALTQALSGNRQPDDHIPLFHLRHQALPESEYDDIADWVPELLPLAEPSEDSEAAA